MEQSKPIQWFPGHMAKTRRKIKEALGLVDMVAELIDARIPIASRNPELDALAAGKPRLLILSKSDMADESATRKWVAYFQSLGCQALAVDCKSGRGIQRVDAMMKEVLADEREKWAQKGMVGRPVRAMVVGIPNVGKSTFINRLAGGTRAKAEDRPGVTRGNQWFTLPSGTQLLDTPGVLWPKFEDQQAALHLAFTGAIRDQILDCEELACELLRLLAAHYRPFLTERYKLTEPIPEDGYALLEAVGRRRGMLISGGEVNTERAANVVLDEYRAGKCGRITLEYPEDLKQSGVESR